MEAQADQSKQALELALHILQNPALSQETKGRAEKLCAELKAQFRADEVEAMQIRSQTKMLEVMVANILVAGTETTD